MNKKTFMAYVHVTWTNTAMCVIYGLINWYGLDVLHKPYIEIWCYVQIITTLQAWGIYWYGNHRNTKLKSSTTTPEKRFSVTGGHR